MQHPAAHKAKYELSFPAVTLPNLAAGISDQEIDAIVDALRVAYPKMDKAPTDELLLFIRHLRMLAKSGRPRAPKLKLCSPFEWHIEGPDSDARA
mmetsp:Transcript_21077/g.52999  ORF Transcript_21077/g.52999 Transcript_21077/m.52999 type:complete len:95 (+) Transcript_21077:55-339(+)